MPAASVTFGLWRGKEGRGALPRTSRRTFLKEGSENSKNFPAGRDSASRVSACGENFLREESKAPRLSSLCFQDDRSVFRAFRKNGKPQGSPFGGKVLAGSQGASFKKPPEWSAGKSPATFSPRISSADCCSRNSQCASSGERRRAFPPRVSRLRRNLREAVRKPRANGIPIPCGARGSAPTPPESPR